MIREQDHTRGVVWRGRPSGGSARRARWAAFAGVAAVAVTALPGPAVDAGHGNGNGHGHGRGNGRGNGTTPAPQLVDTGTMSSIAQIVEAHRMWDAGFTGAGVGVAVIDTGVARVPGLDRPGKVVDGPDLSFDSQLPGMAHTDVFGHGTHMAGIIAGSDVASGAVPKACTTCYSRSPYTDTTKFVGIAPDARIVNVKVGAFDGAVDVTQVIAGINWVVEHRNDPGLNIRVLNLSFGTDSLQPAQVDPLVYAVEAAWRAGIVVVAAGGNDGSKPGPLADPAVSPSVIAVGAVNPMGTLRTNDDVTADFAQHGTSQRGVDIAAPGVSVQSLRVPGGFVDQNVTTGKDGERFQRASGTSEATAVVSGLAALVLSKFPTATPEMVKALLTSNTNAVARDRRNRPEYVGSGVPSAGRLAAATLNMARGLVADAVPPPMGDGSGSLEAARGSYRVAIGGVELRGEIDIFGRRFDSRAAAAAAAASTSWTRGSWNGSQWTADAWVNGTWAATEWSQLDYRGRSWKDDLAADPTAAEWSGARWSGARWSGARWSGARWSGARWSGARWSSAGWA